MGKPFKGVSELAVEMSRSGAFVAPGRGLNVV